MIVSRSALQWLPELVSSISVGTISTSRSDDASHEPSLDASHDRSRRELEEAIRTGLQFAATGVSRLPIVSVESPHPLFSFGACCAGIGSGATADPCQDPWCLWEREVGRAGGEADRVRPWVFEFILRASAADEVNRLAVAVRHRQRKNDRIVKDQRRERSMRPRAKR